MDLEFAQNREDLIFEKEYQLNTKPLQIDFLVIKKKKDVVLKNEIGNFFRTYNIMEYKSPEDSLNIDSLYKTVSYAGLYKAYGKHVDSVPADEVTVSLVREKKPEGLFHYLKEHNISMVNEIPGIYYPEDKFLFPVQIIVGQELQRKHHIWLRALAPGLKKQEMKEFIEQIDRMDTKMDKELADSVLEVSARANREIIENLKEEGDGMCKALLEIMEPEINEIRRNDVIAQLIDTARDYGASDEDVIKSIMNRFNCSEDKARQKIEEFDSGKIKVPFQNGTVI